MADKTFSYCQQALGVRGTKKDDKLPCSSSTLAENMREQPKATKLVYSPRRSTKTVGKSDENSKSKSLVKDAKTKSDDSSSSSLSLFEGREKRTSLQILQPSADGQKLLVGGTSSRKSKRDSLKPKKRTQQRSGLSSTQKQLKHYLPKQSESRSSSSEVENAITSVAPKPDVPSSSDEVLALMVQDQAPEKYWELLAEERRKALEETLEENMKLYEIIESLKAENSALKERASNADYFATIYKITKNDVPPTEDETHDS